MFWALKRERPAATRASCAQTIENTREWDETKVDNNDEENIEEEAQDEFADHFNGLVNPKVSPTVQSGGKKVTAAK